MTMRVGVPSLRGGGLTVREGRIARARRERQRRSVVRRARRKVGVYRACGGGGEAIVSWVEVLVAWRKVGEGLSGRLVVHCVCCSGGVVVAGGLGCCSVGCGQ